MKALVYDSYGGLDTMRVADMPDPEPGPGDVLVEVHAAGINPIDWKLREGYLRGRFELDFPDVAGRDLSGVVVATGENVSDLAVGDAVFGVCPPSRWGSHAELVAVDAAVLAPKPDDVSHIDAGAIALVGNTALTALERTAKVGPGMTVLIHAGAGGVGTFAVQYCKSQGATVYATCSGHNVDFLEGLGADEVVDYTATDFTEVLTDLDVVYDTMGGDTHLRSYRVLKPGGMLVCLNAAPVPEEKPRDDITVETPPVGYTRAEIAHIGELMVSGAVEATVSALFPLGDAVEAYRLSESGHARGKIVLGMK